MSVNKVEIHGNVGKNITGDQNHIHVHEEPIHASSTRDSRLSSVELAELRRLLIDLRTLQSALPAGSAASKELLNSVSNVEAESREQTADRSVLGRSLARLQEILRSLPSSVAGNLLAGYIAHEAAQLIPQLEKITARLGL